MKGLRELFFIVFLRAELFCQLSKNEMQDKNSL